MAGLRDESELYRKLDDMYKNKKSKDITQVFFNECIEVALKFSKRDIQFVLFKLKLLNVDVDSGIETVDNISNSLQKVLDVLTGKNIERSLIINILEIALDEKIEGV